MTEKLEIGVTHPPPYNPNSNQVERFHCTLHTGMHLFLEHDNNWEQQLPAIMLS